MGRPRKAELRERKKEEQTELVRVVKATREGQDAVKRAKALLAVAAGATLSVAGQEADLSREAVAQLVSRFNQRGLAVLETAFGGGRRPTSTSEQRARILTDVQRTPDRKEDQTVTGSWMLRRDALRKTGLPQIAAETIREVRHEAGESSQRTRTWCRTGDALRTRTSGTVMVSDLETPEKNDGSSWRASTRKPTGLSNARKTKRDPLKPSHNLGRRGSQRAILQHTHTRTSGVAPPTCSRCSVRLPESVAPQACGRLRMRWCIPG